MQKIDNTKYIILVAYISNEHLHRLGRDMAKFKEYQEIEAFIPTVKVLVKKLKNKNTFNEVPLLFNYGFFIVPRHLAKYPKYLENMQENIRCIFGWVRDPLKKGAGLFGSIELSDFGTPFATATAQEIANLSKDAFKYSAHSADDLERIKVGDIITLRGYPWDNIEAEILDIDYHKEVVKVKIAIFNRFQEVIVSFANVFFTIYHNNNFDDSLSTVDSLDKMAKDGVMDKKMYQNGISK